jgi:hypothetical protein
MLRLKILICLLASVAVAQSRIPHFETAANVVLMDVQVLDGDTNRPVPGLEAEDFEVLENGAPVALASVSSRRLSLDVVIAVDTSGGYASAGIDRLSRAVFDALGPEDRVGLVSFSRKPTRELPLTDSEGLFRSAIQRTLSQRRKFSETSGLYDGLLEAARMLDAEATDRRNAVLTITYDREGHSRAKSGTVVEAFLRYRVHFEAVVLPLGIDHSGLTMGTATLMGPRVVKTRTIPPRTEILPPFGSVKPVADRTGGWMEMYYELPPRAPGVLDQSHFDRTATEYAEALVRRWRSAYRLSIRGESGETPTFRSVEVRLSETGRAKYPHATVYSRSGYYSAPAGTSR